MRSKSAAQPYVLSCIPKRFSSMQPKSVAFILGHVASSGGTSLITKGFFAGRAAKTTSAQAIVKTAISTVFRTADTLLVFGFQPITCRFANSDSASERRFGHSHRHPSSRHCKTIVCVAHDRAEPVPWTLSLPVSPAERNCSDAVIRSAAGSEGPRFVRAVRRVRADLRAALTVPNRPRRPASAAVCRSLFREPPFSVARSGRRPRRTRLCRTRRSGWGPSVSHPGWSRRQRLAPA